MDIYFLEPDVRFDDKLVYSSKSRTETTMCPVNLGTPSQHAMSQRQPNPIRVIGPVQRTTDIEWTVYRDLLIGPDIAENLRMTQFSGFELREAELYTKAETLIEREVFQLRVTGWGGVAPEESGIQVLKECSHCKWQVLSGFTDANKLFSIDAWDGSDFFIIWPLPKFTFVTGEVAAWFKQSGYSGVRVKPLDKFPKPVANTYTPGRLHDWFDDDRASEIMATLR